MFPSLVSTKMKDPDVDTNRHNYTISRDKAVFFKRNKQTINKQIDISPNVIFWNNLKLISVINLHNSGWEDKTKK